MSVSAIRRGQPEYGPPPIMRLVAVALRRDGVRCGRQRMISFAGAVLLGLVSMAHADQSLPQPPFYSQPSDDSGGRWEWQVVDTTTLQFRVAIDRFVVATNAQGVVVSLQGQVAVMAGMPDLARIATILPGRAGWHASVVTDPVAWRDISGVLVAPGAGYGPVDGGTAGIVHAERREFAAAVYNRDAFWPELPAALLEAWSGTAKLVRVECALLQYNPVRRIVRYATSCSGRVVFYPAMDGRR